MLISSICKRRYFILRGVPRTRQSFIIVSSSYSTWISNFRKVSRFRLRWIYTQSYTNIQAYTPWVAIQASRCVGRVDRILAVKNTGVSLRPSYENGGRVGPPGTIAVLFQVMPGERGSLLIRYPDLVRTMCRPSLGTLSRVNIRAFLQTRALYMCHSTYLTYICVFWVCNDHSIRENVKFITNFRFSLAQVYWNFVDRFLDVQQGPCSSRQLAIVRCCG